MTGLSFALFGASCLATGLWVGWALWGFRHPRFTAVLRELIDIKDLHMVLERSGAPVPEALRSRKRAAWAEARALLAELEEPLE